MVRDRAYDVREPWHLHIKSGNNHLSVFIDLQRLPVFDLRLDTGTEVVVDRADNVDLAVADLINIRQRILVYGMDKSYRKFIPL